jgi:hypothetical protein
MTSALLAEASAISRVSALRMRSFLVGPSTVEDTSAAAGKLSGGGPLRQPGEAKTSRAGRAGR